MVRWSTIIHCYTAGGSYILAIDGIAWELLLFHQPTLCISTFIKWFARIAENMIIVLLFLHYKAMSKISQIPDVDPGSWPAFSLDWRSAIFRTPLSPSDGETGQSSNGALTPLPHYDTT